MISPLSLIAYNVNLPVDLLQTANAVAFDIKHTNNISTIEQ